MHNLLAALRTRLPGCSGFDLAKLLRALADLGYMPARPFLAEFAAAVEVHNHALLLDQSDTCAAGWLAGDTTTPPHQPFCNIHIHPWERLHSLISFCYHTLDIYRLSRRSDCSLLPTQLAPHCDRALPACTVCLLFPACLCFLRAAQPKLSSLDSINLAALMGAFSALKYEPEAAFMRAFYTEVYQKLPLFDDQVWLPSHS